VYGVLTHIKDKIWCEEEEKTGELPPPHVFFKKKTKKCLESPEISRKFISQKMCPPKTSAGVAQCQERGPPSAPAEIII
jgi:hypothetical protein